MLNHMVERSSPVLDRRFAALSDSTRRSIVVSLLEGDRTVSELAAPFAMSLAAVSKHIGVLEQAGLVERRREGRHQRCRIVPGSLDVPARWLEDRRRRWEGRLDRLARTVERKP